ncbi:MAG: hypothetical protein AAGB04_05180 [Pseudomonadota bacterium]
MRHVGMDEHGRRVGGFDQAFKFGVAGFNRIQLLFEGLIGESINHRLDDALFGTVETRKFGFVSLHLSQLAGTQLIHSARILAAELLTKLRVHQVFLKSVKNEPF